MYMCTSDSGFLKFGFVNYFPLVHVYYNYYSATLYIDYRFSLHKLKSMIHVQSIDSIHVLIHCNSYLSISNCYLCLSKI